MSLFLWRFLFFKYNISSVNPNMIILTQNILIFCHYPSSSFSNKRNILYPNYTLSLTKLSCECAIGILFPKYSFLFVYFYSETKVTSRSEFIQFVFLFFSLKKKTHLLHSNFQGWAQNKVYWPKVFFPHSSFRKKRHPIPKLYLFFN